MHDFDEASDALLDTQEATTHAKHGVVPSEQPDDEPDLLLEDDALDADGESGNADDNDDTAQDDDAVT